MADFGSLKSIFLALSCFGGRCLQDKPIVDTPLGGIKGSYQTSYNGRTFSAFEGVPYAKPPIGNLRFEPPVPISPWIGIWDANFTITCAQSEVPYLMNTTQIDEDCLYLNIYVPRKQPSPKDNLDVIVHIHGGAFMYGDAHWYAGPRYIMDREVILVTLNYRLGILGFLSTEDDVVPGNMGLKDQVMALKWIQSNIPSFGGNPKSVTITGVSAGGSSVHLHYFSNMSQNLFQRGVSHSGVALNTFVLQRDALDNAHRLAGGVGCPNDTNKIMVDCLKERPYQHLLSKISLFFRLPYLPVAPFSPVVERGPDPFLEDDPFVLLQKKQLQDLPWLVSNTPHEGLLPVMYQLDLYIINAFWESLAPTLLEFERTIPEPLHDNTTQQIRRFYLKDEEVDENNFYDFVQIFTDRAFLVDTETALKWQSKINKSPVYYYRFNYAGDHNENKTVAHGEDMKYYFYMKTKPLTRNELKMKDVVLDMLVAFAKNGIPEVKGVSFEPTNYTEMTYLDMNGPDDMQLLTKENLTPRRFWRSLGFAENENLVPDLEE